MTPTIPIPTDHIYKFYALCGLAVLIASMLSLVYVLDRYNERAYSAYREWGELTRKDKLSPEEELRKVLLKEKFSVDRLTLNVELKVLVIIFVLGLIGMGYGFIMWQKKVQPNQDKLLLKFCPKFPGFNTRLTYVKAPTILILPTDESPANAI